jgi:predicted acylesterase/phospholipase RssA
LGGVVGLAAVALVSRCLSPQGGLAFVTVALVGALGLLLWRLLRDVRALVLQHYGLCSGHDASFDTTPGATQASAGGAHPPITDWLHRLIQSCAGRLPDGPPLTFADLHGAPGSPRETWGDASEAGAQSIRLEIVAANITQGEPLRFPRSEGDTPLYFCREEFERLFPASVVQHLITCGEGVMPYGPRPVPTAPGTLYPLPRLALPVVVAARMSIAFPFVFEPVPLWRVDDGAPRTRPRGAIDYADCESQLRRCLVFDGGFCSNFPIHLFDGLVPAWPTFGVQLWDLDVVHDLDPARADGAAALDPQVDLPRRGHGRWPLWDCFDEKRKPADRLGGLLRAMLSTTKDWTDNAQARLPGVRDRVVAIGLPPGIGGLNLLMTGEQIRMLAKQGVKAARALLERFGRPDARTGRPAGWDEHRLLRFRLAVEGLRRAAEGLTLAANTRRHATPLRELLADRQREGAHPHDGVAGHARVASTGAGPGTAGAAPRTAQATAGDAGAQAGRSARVPDEDRAFDACLRADQGAALAAALTLLERLETDLLRCDPALSAAPAPTPELHLRPPM